MNVDFKIESEDGSTQPNAVASSGSALPFFLALLVLVGMAYGGWTWWRVARADYERSQAIPADLIGPPLTEFELTERSGQPFRSADMRGRVWVATYFFTSCPGTCVRLNQNVQLMHNLTELKDVTWVSITCDPDNDSAEKLREYADRLNADPERWLFCRADLDYTKRVARGMNLFLARKGHQDYAIVFDKSGKTRGMFDAVSQSGCQQLRALLLKCVDESPPHEVAATAAAEGESS